MIVNCFVISGSASAGSQQNLVRQEFTLQNHGRRNVRYIRKVRRNQTDKSVRISILIVRAWSHQAKATKIKEQAK